MKKNSPRPEKKHERQSSTIGAKHDKNLIFGHYQKFDGQGFVFVGNNKYMVCDIKSGIDLPIAQRAKVKALIKQARGGKKEAVVVLKVYGPELSLAQKIKALLKDAEIPIEFDQHIIKEADAFGKNVETSDLKNRLDLSKHALVTIDGETAKDFDDAVFAQKKGKNIEVIIAIADVSHYVKVGSKLDEEALRRGTSIYYPGACVPMLPEQLSNGLCSLKPNTLRLALSLSFELGPKGGVFFPKIRQSVIKSQARLTYQQVQDFYDKKPGCELKISPAIKNSLETLEKASAILRKSRHRRGAIDFDIAESIVSLDDKGEPTVIHPAARLNTHKIIEDLMVATNEIVAQYFEEKNIPSLYRVHEPPNPEKLQTFFTAAHAFGVLKSPAKTKAANIKEPKDLQSVMALYQDSKAKGTLNILMLRAMMQARYSEQNLMHFGLASSAYLHFTSPIRRYADLIVHRQLRYVLFEKNNSKKISNDTLAHIAESISLRESAATDLERKIDRLYAATFLSSHIGESFDAQIVSCTDFGLFIRITEHHVEGLVHISTISKSRVNFIPEKFCLVVSGSNITYNVGDEVRVKLMNVNIERGFIDFELEQNAQKTEILTKPKSKNARSKKNF